ncbi:MAG: TIGR00730 family Rossman fold protein [Paludibacteraceae bacterium]|nr:TIGR00730 family Rossman fold protein [Paludibacteraceae bacterium]
MNIAVYCSAKDTIPEEYKQLGDELGQWLATQGHNLVYGGATGGLMTRVSMSYKQTRCSEQELIGVVPSRIIASGRKADHCDRIEEVNNMAERKQRMREIADCFIVLPGSYGTLDELFDVVASGTVGEHKKPVYIVNYNGFYDGLKTTTAHMRALHFIPQEEAYKPIYVESLAELYHYF